MQPCTMPHCLQPHGRFPAPPPYAFNDPNAPHSMMTCFPPSYNTLCLQITASITKTYTPPESFPIDPLLPILYIISLHSQSLMTDVFPPESFNDTDSDWDHTTPWSHGSITQALNVVVLMLPS